MKGEILVDTNIVIYALQGIKHVHRLIKDESLCLSFVSEIELLSWPKLTSEDLKTTKKFMERFKIIEYSSDLKEGIVNLKKNYKLNLSDAIVVASAIHLDIPLITADGSLRRVKELNSYLVKI